MGRCRQPAVCTASLEGMEALMGLEDNDRGPLLVFISALRILSLPYVAGGQVLLHGQQPCSQRR